MFSINSIGRHIQTNDCHRYVLTRLVYLEYGCEAEGCEEKLGKPKVLDFVVRVKG